MKEGNIPPEKLEVIKKKYPDVTDELLTDLASAMDVDEGDGDDEENGGGDSRGSFEDLGHALKEGDMTFTQLMFWQDRQDRRERWEDKQDERRREERLRQEKPAWLEPLLTRLDKLETKTEPPQSEHSKMLEAQLSDVKDKLEEQKKDHESVLAELREERTKAKDEAQRTYIDGKIADITTSVKRLEDLIEKTSKPADTKDFFDQLKEVQEKGKRAGIEITVGEGGTVAKNREDVAIEGAQGVVREGKEVLKDARLLLKEITDDVIIPRMRVESGISKTGLLTDKDKQAYYDRIGLKLT